MSLRNFHSTKLTIARNISSGSIREFLQFIQNSIYDDTKSWTIDILLKMENIFCHFFLGWHVQEFSLFNPLYWLALKWQYVATCSLLSGTTCVKNVHQNIQQYDEKNWWFFLGNKIGEMKLCGKNFFRQIWPDDPKGIEGIPKLKLY